MSKSKTKSIRGSRFPWLLALGIAIGLLAVGGVWFALSARASEPKEAPEAEKILSAQADMPFQILIPAYLPKDFDRPDMEISINQVGPGGEPMVQLTYRTRKGSALFIRQWVPINPEKEVLASSRPIETKWGRGWLLHQGEELIVIWVDVGPLRLSIYTSDQVTLPIENLLAVAENMGPASNRQVFDFVLEPPQVRQVEPPPPFEVPTDEQGIQAFDLIITPGGYSPLRFSVKKGVPVKLTFRQLGRVGCGNELNLPYSADKTAFLRLDDPSEAEVFEFTPAETGEFEFFCAHLMYRGLMVVRE